MNGVLLAQPLYILIFSSWLDSFPFLPEIGKRTKCKWKRDKTYCFLIRLMWQPFKMRILFTNHRSVKEFPIPEDFIYSLCFNPFKCCQIVGHNNEFAAQFWSVKCGLQDPSSMPQYF